MKRWCVLVLCAWVLWESPPGSIAWFSPTAIDAYETKRQCREAAARRAIMETKTGEPVDLITAARRFQCWPVGMRP